MFSFYAGQDPKNSEVVVPQVIQGGLSLPDRDYYLKGDDRSKMIREEFVKHVTKMFELYGLDAATAKKNADTLGGNAGINSITAGDGDDTVEGLFYSRRIGRRPQYSPDLPDGQYAQIPEFTSILGASVWRFAKRRESTPAPIAYSFPRESPL